MMNYIEKMKVLMMMIKYKMRMMNIKRDIKKERNINMILKIKEIFT